MHFRWKSRFAQKGRRREGSTGSERLLCKSEIVKQSKRICMNTKIKYLTKYEYTETDRTTTTTKFRGMWVRKFNRYGNKIIEY